MIARTTLLVLGGLLAAGQAGAVSGTAPPAANQDAPAPTRAAAAPAASTPERAQKPQSGNPLWGIPLGQLSATRERPLFAPTRRPPPPVIAAPIARALPPPPPKLVEPEKPQLALVGTVAGDGEGIGVFVDQAARTVLRLKMGENHKGWVLRVVQRREVTLEKGREKAVLVLPEPDKKKAATTMPPGMGSAAVQALQNGLRLPGGPRPPLSPEDAPDSPEATGASELAVGFNPFQSSGAGP
jgi:hypothetical protein